MRDVKHPAGHRWWNRATYPLALLRFRINTAINGIDNQRIDGIVNPMSDTYRIVFTQRTTMATTFSRPIEKGGKAYFLKAKAAKSAQHVGYAIVYPDMIEVITVSGALVGVAQTRTEAAQMIDSYQRTNNADAYWMWADKELAK